MWGYIIKLLTILKIPKIIYSMLKKKKQLKIVNSDFKMLKSITKIRTWKGHEKYNKPNRKEEGFS